MWLMEERSLQKHGVSCSHTEFPLVGQFSPTHPVTLTSEEKQAINIPEAAIEFAWSYPVADWEELRGTNIAVKSFLTVGGYIYRDRSHRVIHVTTLVPSEAKQGGLQFKQQLKWDSSWTAPLMRNGRFQPITIKSLRDVG